MKFMFRWIANSIALYLALYLVDSLIAPRFWLQAVWLGVILAVFLGLLNSLFRPLHRVKTKTFNALTVAVLTVLVNTLILQIFIWIGAPLSATSIRVPSGENVVHPIGRPAAAGSGAPSGSDTS